MPNRLWGAPLTILTSFFLLLAPPAGAVDINYYPQEDTASEKYKDNAPITVKKEKLLPGQRPAERKRDSQKGGAVTSKQEAKDEPEEGWSVKAPAVASDNTTFVKGQRESVKRAEERMREDRNEYSDDPLDPEQYRITIEAEYKF